jgi:hypothetical protein
MDPSIGDRFVRTAPRPPHFPQNAPGLTDVAETPSFGKISRTTAATRGAVLVGTYSS